MDHVLHMLHVQLLEAQAQALVPCATRASGLCCAGAAGAGGTSELCRPVELLAAFEQEVADSFRFLLAMREGRPQLATALRAPLQLLRVQLACSDVEPVHCL